MLNDKDYCDYETCVALKELGYKEKTLAYYTSEGFFHWVRAYIYDVAIPDLANSGNKKPYKHIIDAMSLYEAQKWLRNTHNLHISTKPYPCEDGLMWMYEIRRFTPYLVCVIKNKTGFREEEEALSEGIKEAVKILKDK